jgi:hypothetical protein
MREVVVVLKIDENMLTKEDLKRSDKELVTWALDHNKIWIIDGWYILDEH